MSLPGQSADSVPKDPPTPRWSRLLHQADDSIFVLNSRRRLLYANPAWEKWAGLSFASVRGRSCRSSTEIPILSLLAPSKEALAGAMSRVRRRLPNAAWCDIHFFPVRKEGRIVALVGRIDAATVAVSSTAPPLPEKLIQLREQSLQSYRLELWESRVPAVNRVVAQARLAVQIATPIMLQGPTGCGKEWLARTIHHLSRRHEEFFASFDAAKLPSALIADLLLSASTRMRLGGILLRNPASLRADLQIKLAELLAAETFGPRLFISVKDAAEATQLTPELLSAVSILTLVIPSLKERLEDWPRFVAELLPRVAAATKKYHPSISPQADEALRAYPWPGNFRELDDTLRDALAHAAGDRIEIADLPFLVRNTPIPPEPKLPLDSLLENAERRLIKLALEQAKNNKSKAAEILGVWRPRLLRRMEQLGIEGPGEDADAKP